MSKSRLAVPVELVQKLFPFSELVNTSDGWHLKHMYGDLPVVEVTDWVGDWPKEIR